MPNFSKFYILVKDLFIVEALLNSVEQDKNT